MLQRSLFSSVTPMTLPEQPRADAVDIAPGLAKGYATLWVKGPDGMRTATPEEIFQAAKATAEARMPSGITMTDPKIAAEFFLAKLMGREAEVVAVAFLNTQRKLIAYEEPFRGTLAECGCWPREIVKLALKHNAASIILGHPHPSGLTEPSPADVAITKRIREALALVDVRVEDHFIVGGGASYSMAMHGKM